MKTRIYRIRGKNATIGFGEHMVEASSGSQALRHVVSSMFDVDVASAIDVAKHMRAGLPVESASADPDAPQLPGIQTDTPTMSGIEAVEVPAELSDLGVTIESRVREIVETLIARNGMTVDGWNTLGDENRRESLEEEMRVLKAERTALNEHVERLEQSAPEPAPRRRRGRETPE